MIVSTNFYYTYAGSISKRKDKAKWTIGLSHSITLDNLLKTMFSALNTIAQGNNIIFQQNTVLEK